MSTDLTGIQASWDAAAAQDAIGHILTDQQHSVQDYLISGEIEIAIRLGRAEELGLSVQGMRALDFGCGLGRCVLALGSRYEYAVGLDVSGEMITQARDMHAGRERLQFVHHIGTSLPFEDACFDLVYSSLVLQHMPNALSFAYLDEMLRVCASDGSLIIEAPDGPDIAHINPALSMWSLSRTRVEDALKAGADVLAVDLINESSPWDCLEYYARKR